MRIRHSFKLLVPVLAALLSGLSAKAQSGAVYPSPGPMYYNGPPGYAPMQGAQMASYAPMQGGQMAGYAPMPGGPMPGQGYPPSFAPAPALSHYDHMLEQYFSSDGTWFRNATDGFGAFNHPRSWYFGAEYTRTRTRQMRGIVGDEGVATYAQMMDPENDQVLPGLSFYNYFNPASASFIPELSNNGIKLNGGFWNTDGSGLLLTANWVADDTSTFDARRNMEEHRLPRDTVLRMRRNQGRDDGAIYNSGGPSDLDLTKNDILGEGVPFDTVGNQVFADAPWLGTTFDILDRTLMNLYGIPINNGSFSGIPGTGATVPYDINFILKHSITNYGATADWAFSPIYESGAIKVRPILGGRYYHIDESFGFRGESSLLSYGATNGDNDTPINAKVHPVANGVDDDGDFIIDNPDEPSNTPTTTPTAFFVPLTGLSDQLWVQSYLDSTVVSDLAGPQIGFHYELGDNRGIRLTGLTRVGALFNTERIHVHGDNIGNFMGVEVTPDPITGANIATPMFDTNNNDGPTENAFSDKSYSTHISPMFEQGLNAQVPLFKQVPVLRDMWQLEDANLTLGWSYLLIGEIADPNQSINWTSAPILGETPVAKPDRYNFGQSTLSIGINWNY